jgi:beta-lactamase regulating signal transducer with metallopeptidase domain
MAGKAAADNPQTTMNASVQARPSPPTLLSWKSWLMLLHLAGTVAVLAWIAGELVWLHRLIKHARCLANDEGSVRPEWTALARQLRLPRLLVAVQPCCPMAFGIFRPTVLLPRAVPERHSSADFELISAHELAHIRRRDLWVIWPQFLLLAVWWFHPVLWLVNRSLRRIREDCCDDLILARGITSATNYCEVLGRAARAITAEVSATPLLDCAERLHPLGDRVTRLMDTRIARWPRLSTAGICGVFLMALMVLPGLRIQENTLANSDNTQASVLVVPAEPPLSRTDTKLTVSPASIAWASTSGSATTAPIRLSRLVGVKAEN